MQNNSQSPLQFPSIGRRLICMIYEALLLTAVLMLATGLFLLVTRAQQSPVLDRLKSVWLFVVMGVYFIHQWVDSGHTLAMKTWRIKLVMPGASRVPVKTATLRYLLLMAWFVPALAMYAFIDIHSGKMMASLLLACWVAMLLSTLFNKDKQFLHDRILGTYLIQLPKKQAA